MGTVQTLCLSLNPNGSDGSGDSQNDIGNMINQFVGGMANPDCSSEGKPDIAS